jgi:FMN-dependent NADH-azoreductase
MTHVLQITSSIFGDGGESSRLAGRFVAQLAQRDSGLRVTRRDVATAALPHLDAERFSALATPAAERTARQQDIAAESDRLVDELQRADVLVLGVPMYNFAIPSQLKAWFDHVARAGITFRYTADGPEGLLHGRRAVVFMTRGGVYDAQSDLETPYVRQFLAFLGITEVEFVHAEGLAMGEGHREAGRRDAERGMEHLLAAA